MPGKIGIYNMKVNVDAMYVHTYLRMLLLSYQGMTYDIGYALEYMCSTFISGLELVSLDYLYLLYDRKT